MHFVHALNCKPIYNLLQQYKAPGTHSLDHFQQYKKTVLVPQTVQKSCTDSRHLLYQTVPWGSAHAHFLQVSNRQIPNGHRHSQAAMSSDTKSQRKKVSSPYLPTRSLPQVRHSRSVSPYVLAITSPVLTQPRLVLDAFVLHLPCSGTRCALY